MYRLVTGHSPRSSPSSLPSTTLIQRPRTRILAYLVLLALFSLFSLFFLLDRYPTSSAQSWRTLLGPLYPAPQAHRFETPAHPSTDMTITQNAAPETLADFLRRTKATALEHLGGKGRAAEGKLVLILGNEAGDLDSIASAVGLSYLLTHYSHADLPGRGSSLPSSPPATYVPVIQTNRGDLYLRQENVAVLAAAGVDSESLLMINDLDAASPLALDLATSPALSPASNVSFGLVDHASLSERWGGSPTSPTLRDVSIVVDHHADDEEHLDAALRVIHPPGTKMVGSAASIVATLFTTPLKSSTAPEIPSQLADLLLGAIAIDTDNLRPAKSSMIDEAALFLLVGSSSFAPTRPDGSKAVIEAVLASGAGGATLSDVAPAGNDGRPTLASSTHAFWSALSSIKSRVAHLSGRDLLRRDYKGIKCCHSSTAGTDGVFLTTGFSSVPIGLPTWLHKHRGEPFESATPPEERLSETDAEEDWKKWWTTLEEWMEEKDMDLAVVLTSFREYNAGEEKRDAVETRGKGSKHRREFVLAFRPPPAILPKADALFASLREELQTDAHTDPTDAPGRLLLEWPWKGVRLTTSKRERLRGVDAQSRVVSAKPARPIWAAVYRQGNAKANRKIALPAVLTALSNVVMMGRPYSM